ncbi:dnaJ homolog subfamily C member 14-like [Sinocyclocheilus grahami]|uniref:dnaJ homolog subfamily C member 14-like n=1 Tax=Sinocyclocheilus grahami TaxID=75366 RepID=UPI0007AD319D|nr:PREDICTED: dnaJ homolog subfamily C member 14-like [Sinocyclocheilus grahami]
MLSTLALVQIPEEELDPFNVLGVDIHATESELKRAYRQLAVQVHPDKNKHPGAGEAFKVLRAAWDIVSNPETRREYELKRMAATELSKSMNEFLTKLQDDLKEAINTMMCTKCEGKHKRFEMEREPGEARFCAECSKWHSAEEGDLWAESSMLGLRITYFAFMDGKVFDITEWAGCQHISISPDTHRVPYHISFGSKGSSGTSGTSRHRSAPDHAAGGGSPADLQDFFNRFFQGGAPSDMSANGGIFPTGNPPPHSSGAAAGTSTTFSGSSPQTGFFSPGAQRGDPSEHWTDGGKPPRRRKKVRKPFQC